MRVYDRYVLLVFFLALQIKVFSQGVNIDSLVQITRSGREDTNTVIAFRAVCGAYGNSDPRKGIPFGWKGVALGKKIGWDKGVAGCYLNLGHAYTNLGVYDSAIQVLDTAVIYSKRAGDPKRTALVYINQAATHIYTGNLEKAMQAALLAEPYANASNDPDRMGRVYMTIGNIYYYQERWSDALPYYKKCLPLFEKVGVTNMVGTSLMNLAIIYKNLGVIDSAFLLTNESIALFNSVQDNERLIIAYSNLGAILQLKGEMAGAEQNYKKAVDLSMQMGDKEQEVFNRHSLGEIYFLRRQYEKAKEILLPALDTASRYAYYEELGNITETLAQVYAETGDYKQAFKYLQMFNAAADTIDQRAQNEQLIALQEQYQAEQREQEIALLNANSALQDKALQQKRLVNSLLLVGLVALLLAGAVIWNRYRLRQQLKELAMRNKIASDLHDDVGASLSSIKMYSEIIKGEIPAEKKSAGLFLGKISEIAGESIGNMSDIVWMVKPGNDRLENLVNRMHDYAQDMCNSAGIALHIDLKGMQGQISLPMELRRDVHLIFKEAVNNTVKYSGAKDLFITLSREHTRLILTIRDNGKGFELTPKQNGNGLSNMRARAEKYGGSCKITSAPDTGTTVHAVIPLT